ncbi:MAG: HD domain-containing protein [Alphaproteobacteria bacterium]|nr:HD domain-containing protein [Alphaproteobacteria bacterium]
MVIIMEENEMKAKERKFVEFHEIIGDLKHLRRIGWVMREVPQAETVASHSWRMALMAMQKEIELKELGVDVNRVIEMCLLHDVAEAVVGDIVPEAQQMANKKILKAEKAEREMAAIDNFASKYDFPKLKKLFEEYEEQVTLEAQVTKNLDKMDMLLQAYEYSLACPDLSRLGEFMQYDEQDVNLPIFKDDLQEIKARQYDKKTKVNKFVDFQLLAGKLKHLERSGPKMYGIEDCETVAAHSYRSALMALYLEKDLQKQGLNVSDVVKIALVHDMGEAVIGDVVPEKWQKGTKISKAEKHKREVQAIMMMSKQYDVPFVWQAFDAMEQRTTPEASMAKDLEIFEGIQQAFEYIKKYPEKGILREWVPYHQPRIKSDLVQGLVVAVKEKQDKFLISKNYPTVYKEGGR